MWLGVTFARRKDGDLDCVVYVPEYDMERWVLQFGDLVTVTGPELAAVYGTDFEILRWESHSQVEYVPARLILHTSWTPVIAKGLDRELIKESDFTRFAGRAVEVRTYEQINGSKEHEGILKGKQDGVVTVETAAGELAIPADKISKINLAVIF